MLPLLIVVLGELGLVACCFDLLDLDLDLDFFVVVGVVVGDVSLDEEAAW